MRQYILVSKFTDGSHFNIPPSSVHRVTSGLGAWLFLKASVVYAAQAAF